MSPKPVYPDALGAVTGGHRIMVGGLQYAVGVFPQQAFRNQPFEIIVILQNMLDKPTTIGIQLNLPIERDGMPLIFEAAATSYQAQLGRGETGAVRIPVVALPPTPPADDYALRVTVDFPLATTTTRVRPPDGGPPPSTLSVSPFQIQAFEDVVFFDSLPEYPAIVDVVVALSARVLGQPPASLKVTYTSLWSQRQMAREQASSRASEAWVLQRLDEAGSPAYQALYDATEERFADGGMPLHPGEAMAIAKMMAFITDYLPLRNKRYKVSDSRWFRSLCQTVGQNPRFREMPRGELLATLVYDQILFDAVGVGFSLVQPLVSVDIGSVDERLQYAEDILMWLAGLRPPDLNYVYLPLVMAGMRVNRSVQVPSVQPRYLLDQVREASMGRLRLMDSSPGPVFVMVGDIRKRALMDLDGRSDIIWRD
jgi:hypothetical protein